MCAEVFKHLRSILFFFLYWKGQRLLHSETRQLFIQVTEYYQCKYCQSTKVVFTRKANVSRIFTLELYIQ
jgi:hypothetical protein